MLVSGACASSHVAVPTVSGATASAIPGVSNRPDLVTVVPFVHPPELTRMGYVGFVIIEADVDGHRGVWIVDTGSPFIGLNGVYFQPNPTGGIDTVTTGQGRETDVTVHTLRIGTLVQRLDPGTAGPPLPPSTNAIISDSGLTGILGNLGLNAMEPFETIVDYAHQRLVLIRLDPTGHRLVDVPAYPPRGTMPMVPVNTGFSWGILAARGQATDSLILDTGSLDSAPFVQAQERAADQLRDAIAAGPRGAGVSDTPVIHLAAGEKIDQSALNLLGYHFLSHLGVVGFNLRTHQFIVYR